MAIKPLPRRLQVKAGLYTLAIVAYIVVIIITAYYNKAYNRQEKDLTTKEMSKFNTSAQYPVSATEFPSADEQLCRNYNFILIKAAVSSILAARSGYSLRISIEPCGDFADYAKQRAGTAPLTRNGNITIGQLQVDFEAGKGMVSGSGPDPVLRFKEGDYYLYPLDTYDTGVVPITGIYYNSTINSTIYSLPMALTFISTIQGFESDVPLVTDASNQYDSATKSYVSTYDGTILAFRLRVTRSWTTKFFSVVVMAITWTLPLLVFTMAITLLARGRAVEPPTIMVFVSLLFTLPTIRLAQPAVPKEAGCLSDVVSYFWAMTLMSFSAILMLTNYIHKYRAPNVQAPQTAAQKKDNRDINASLVVGASDDVEANAGAGMGGGGAGAAGGFDMQDAGGGGDDAGGGE